MVCPFQVQLPAMGWCSCCLSQMRSSSSASMAREVVCTRVLFCKGSRLSGCFKPSIHWSMRAATDTCKNSRSSFCSHICDGHGFSKWACRPEATCSLPIRLQSFKWIRAFCCFHWTRQSPGTLRAELNLFHGLQGAHSGASHICLGSYSIILISNSVRPALVDRPPSSYVNRWTRRPHSCATLVNSLLG